MAKAKKKTLKDKLDIYFMDDTDCESREAAEEMAIEWFDYNSVGAWYGEKTPIFISTTLEDLE